MQYLAIDADPLVYEAGFAIEHNFYDVTSKGHLVASFEGKRKLNEWLEESGKTEKDFIIHLRAEPEPLCNAIQLLRTKLNNMVKEIKPEQVYLYLTSTEKGHNFRDYLAVSRKYKSRKSSRPIYYKELRDWLVSVWDARVVIGYEADDSVAMLQYTAAEEDESCMIATIDKDLDMVPGWHYNYQKKLMYSVTPEEAMHNFYMQLLKGDTVDSIPGVPQIGEKKASAALENCVVESDYHDAAKALYKAHFGEAWEYAMIEQGRLLWMLRHPADRWFPYNDKRRKQNDA